MKGEVYMETIFPKVYSKVKGLWAKPSEKLLNYHDFTSLSIHGPLLKLQRVEVIVVVGTCQVASSCFVRCLEFLTVWAVVIWMKNERAEKLTINDIYMRVWELRGCALYCDFIIYFRSQVSDANECANCDG